MQFLSQNHDTTIPVILNIQLIGWQEVGLQTGILAHGIIHLFVQGKRKAGVTNEVKKKKKSCFRANLQSSIQQERASSFDFSQGT